MRKRTLVMVVLDGLGIGTNDRSNPIHEVNPKNINYIKHTYPAGTLQASGIAVGLPWDEEGDSEVGHLTLGAGKVLYHHYPRISLTIKNGDFFKNKELMRAVWHAKKNGSAINLVGLVGEGNTHSSLEHLHALIKLCRDEQVPKINLHIFTDGMGGTPEGAIEIIANLPVEMLASISGRYFAMDNDLHWDRTKRVYDTLVGNIGGVGVVGNKQTQRSERSGDSNGSSTPDISDISKIFRDAYAQGLTDKFIEPIIIQPDKVIKNDDSIVFFNFREDRTRQIAHMFLDTDVGIEHEIPKNLFVVTFTKYGSDLVAPVAFPAEHITNPLGKVLSDAGKVQLRIAETSKYAHVTYFFNGYSEKPFENEYRVLIPSKNVAHPEEYPQMMAKEVTARAISAISEGVYDFILINYANMDVMGHTGNYDAAVEAIGVVDEQVGLLLKAVLENAGILVITSDHGNVERMLDPLTGTIQTAHETNPVPLYVIAQGYERNKSKDIVNKIEKTKTGVLSDVAPTVLHLMGIQKPPEMTGFNLLESLR